MNNIRVLHILNSFDIGGMENGIVNLIVHSDKKKITHAVCALRGIGRAGEFVRNEGVKLFALSNEPDSPNRTIFLDICKVINKFKPDIIHVRHWGPLWDTVIAHLLTLRKAKLVFSFHGKTYYEYCNRSKSTDLKRKVLLMFVDEIVTLNNDMLGTLRKEVRLDKHITVIPNGVDTEKFAPLLSNDDLKNALGLPGQKVLFGTVGRLSKIKDMSTIIEACRLLKKNTKKFAVFIIGDGAEKNTLMKSISSNDVNDVVFLLGAKNNVDQYLKCFDVYLQASLYEGFSNTILEAMSSGLPLIVTSVGGNPDLVHEGGNGLLFPPRQPEILADHMLNLVENKNVRMKLALQSRNMAVNNWSIMKMIDAYEKFYFHCLGGNQCH